MSSTRPLPSQHRKRAFYSQMRYITTGPHRHDAYSLIKRVLGPDGHARNAFPRSLWASRVLVEEVKRSEAAEIASMKADIAAVQAQVAKPQYPIDYPAPEGECVLCHEDVPHYHLLENGHVIPMVDPDITYRKFKTPPKITHNHPM